MSVDCHNWIDTNHPHGGQCRIAQSGVSVGTCAACLRDDLKGKHLLSRDDSLKATQKMTMKLEPCVHLGKLTGETRPCGTACGGKLNVPIHRCDIYTICTVRNKVNDVALCSATCKGYSSA